jgi:hypothetical protein
MEEPILFVVDSRAVRENRLKVETTAADIQAFKGMLQALADLACYMQAMSEAVETRDALALTKAAVTLYSKTAENFQGSTDFASVFAQFARWIGASVEPVKEGQA